MAFTAIASPTSRLPCCSPCSASSPPSPTAGSSCAATSSNEGGLMDFLAEMLVSALIVIGGIFGLVGSYGLVKLPDLMTSLHSPTTSSSLGLRAEVRRVGNGCGSTCRYRWATYH